MSASAYPATLHPSRQRRTAGPGAPLGVALLCALGLALVWVLAALVPATHLRDAVLLHDVAKLHGPGVDPVARFVVHLLEPLLFVLWAVALAAIALAQQRPRVALALVGVMGLAPLSAEVLKPLAAHAHARAGSSLVSAASWPSGHAAAALALVLSAVLVARPPWRALVACVGALYTLAVAVSLLILSMHMPSDVLGGLLVATLWMALAVAALRAAERRWPSPSAQRRDHAEDL
jgi:membrane-associated phospholipid phosphatase